MSTQQKVLETGPRPHRRALRTLLLASVPIAVAAAGGLVASSVAPTPVNSAQAAAVDPDVREVSVIEQQPVGAHMNVQAAVIAPAVATDVSDAVPQIQVSFPPEPEPEPVAPAATAGNERSNGGANATATSGSKAPRSSQATSSGSKAQAPAKASAPKKQAPKQEAAAPKKQAPAKQSFDSYCSSASSNASAGGSVKGLLSAANQERARLGIKPMSWSGSLASSATKWSQAMAAKDPAGNRSALAHNPNRPGAENVAVAGSAGGMSAANAVNRAHRGWMGSPGHCRNLLNPAYSTMGAGTATTENGQAVYTTANFR